MIATVIRCDRCKQLVDTPPAAALRTGATCGYYRRGAWSEFMDADEQDVCDDCIWNDPRYVAVYGAQFGTKVGLPTEPPAHREQADGSQ